jgi:hypothetical protein
MRNTWRSRLSLLLIAAFVVVGLAGVPAASAQSSLDDPSSAQYDPPLPQDTAGASAAGSNSSGLDSNIGSLPFTGMDVLIIAGVALLLTGTGFALRRLSTPPEPRG